MANERIVSETESKIYKRFKNLGEGNTPLPQGDAQIRISPFDDYYLFTLFEEIDSEDQPIDLSNIGDLYLSFIGEDDEIRIKNYTNVEDIDTSNGEVVFRISKEESKRILSLDNNTFYISSKIESDEGESDESALYVGTFLTIREQAEETLIDRIEREREQYVSDITALEEQISELQSQLDDANILIGEQESTIEALKNSNQEINNELNEINQELESNRLDEAVERANAAQKSANTAIEQNKKRVSQGKGTTVRTQSTQDTTETQPTQTRPNTTNTNSGNTGTQRGQSSLLRVNYI